MLLQNGSISLTALISQIAMFEAGGHQLIRLWCSECHTASELVEGVDAMMRVKKVEQPKCVLAALEHVALTRLSVEDKGDHLEFRYVF